MEKRSKRKSFIQVIGDKFTIGDGCWEWTGAINSQGYGSVQIDGRGRGAHRVIYEWLVGSVPEGMVLDHVCHNESDCCGGVTCRHRRCVNPSHLEQVLFKTNIRRGRNWMALKTHCPQGHEYTPENTYHPPGEGPHRVCRTCNRDGQRANRSDRTREIERRYQERRKLRLMSAGA